MIKAYLCVLKSVPDPNKVVSLPYINLSRPLLLGQELNTKIAKYIQALRLVVGAVNHSIVQAAAKGILLPTRIPLCMVGMHRRQNRGG